MRRMRLPLVSAIAMALLVGSAIGVAGQEDTEPTTTDELLAGFVTEEVEPGVLRVVSDGFHDLDDIGGTIAAGLDGNVWVFDQRAFFRLGDEGSHDWPERARRGITGRLPRIEVGPDGTIWHAQEYFGPPGGPAFRLRSFDGDSWTVRKGPPLDLAVVWRIEQTPDGTLWALWENKNEEWVLARLDGDRWRKFADIPIQGDIPQHEDLIGFAADAKPWFRNRDRLLGPDADAYRRHDVPDGFGLGRSAVGPDGSVWSVLHYEGEVGPAILHRFDGSDWERYDWSEGLPLYRLPPYFGRPYPHNGLLFGFFIGASNGLWLNPGVAGSEGVEIIYGRQIGGPCGGVAHFDGDTLSNYLTDQCIHSMDVAADGIAWVLASDEPDGPAARIYIITPEAVAATE